MIAIIIALMLITTPVEAQTYTPTANYFGGTQEEYLINIAKNRIDNFETKNFIIFQNDTEYDMIIFKEYTVSGNYINMTNTQIIRYYREQIGSYNYNYTYEIKNETNTQFNMSYIYITNLKTNKSTASNKKEEFDFKQAVIGIIMLILAFQIVKVLTKERTYI